MSHYVSSPVLAIVGSFLAIIIAGLAFVLLSGAGVPITVANSNALASTGQGFNDMLPYIGIILAGGIILGGLSRKR